MTKWCLPLLLGGLLSACSDDFTSTADGGQVTTEAGFCAIGETRCENNIYQRCSGGMFADFEDCGNRACTTDGCAGCDPEFETTCQGNDVHKCNPDGTVGDFVEKCVTTSCGYGRCATAPCSAETLLIYVVDSSGKLLSFSPANNANTFQQIATLSCPAGQPLVPGFGPATPFSMSVDRNAKAWVLYSSGEIFHVDTKTGDCTATGFQKSQQGFEQFGMGFVSDSAGSQTEKLYIAGGAAMDLTKSNLGYIDTTTLKITPLGALEKADQSPELTGTGNAALFGYYPGMANTFVAELDKITGAPKQKWPLPPLEGQSVAWAFAHWGGMFYIFVTTADWLGLWEQSNVLRLDPATGAVETLLREIPYRIVGAGVSTCAPTVIE